jgi:PhzF family phenazine biosynthesis protein
MKLKLYQIDAFTNKVFSGNPAAIVPLRGKWLSKSVMQSVAMENNLSETAFYIHKDGKYHIRWFTPKKEVDLCGHATLACVYAIFYCEGYDKQEINFYSKSGALNVRKEGNYLTMNFPADTIREIKPSKRINSCFNTQPYEVLKGKTDYMLVYNNEKQILNLKADFSKICEIKTRGVIVTAKGKHSDFVSRFFCPAYGVNEDPVTGSAHTTLIPYWSKRLNKEKLTAIQLSQRRGFLKCTKKGGRVEISGRAQIYMTGEIDI